MRASSVMNEGSQATDRSRRTVGSFFEAPSATELSSGTPDFQEVLNGFQFANSGRGALSTSLASWRRDRTKGTVWLPSYYCWDVERYIAQNNQVKTYRSTPFSVEFPELTQDDVLVVVSYFGQIPPLPSVDPDQVFLDTTHDPLADWLTDFPARWRFGSLRKTLPLPDGGYYVDFVGDPVAYALLVDPANTAFALDGFDAMQAKSDWLRGKPDAKRDFYQRYLHQENVIAEVAPSALSQTSHELLSKFPVSEWRSRRLRNIGHLSRRLQASSNLRVLDSTFGVPVVSPTSAHSKALAKALIAEGVFPARLWPQPPDRSEEASIAGRLLTLHTDYRYEISDMDRVARIVQQAIQ